MDLKHREDKYDTHITSFGRSRSYSLPMFMEVIVTDVRAFFKEEGELHVWLIIGLCLWRQLVEDEFMLDGERRSHI